MVYSRVNAISREHGEIEFVQLPTATKNVLSTQANGQFGTISVNEIKAINQRIWHSHFDINEDTHLSLTLQDEVPSLRLIFTLKHNMRFAVNGSKNIRLKHQYNLVYNPQSDIEYEMKKGKEYAAFVIFMRYDWLLQWKDSVNELSRLLGQVDQKIPILISKAPTALMRNIIQELINNRSKRSIFIEAKVLELLNLVRAFSILLISVSLSFNPPTWRCVVSSWSRDYLLKHITRPITIVELAKLVHLNEKYLKHGFKQLFGFTIHDFVLQERMQLASKLLRDTDSPIKQIAKVVGYKSYPHFSAAFKKRFGYSAKSIKRS